MMHQDDPQERPRARIRHVPERHLERKPYEVAYLMKLGDLDKAEALALIAKHSGDNFKITADLFSRRYRPS